MLASLATIMKEKTALVTSMVYFALTIIFTLFISFLFLYHIYTTNLYFSNKNT